MKKSIFEMIIDRELESEIIYEDDLLIAIFDKFPHNKHHFLVIPKKKTENLKDADSKTISLAFNKAVELANLMRSQGKFEDFKVLVNNGPLAGQEIYHLHIHVIPYY
ncbi:histidine triad (HIT) family protein [Mycoplasma testudineum]|uniref:Histidine triad (HIT) family protein n=1 Tax=Mycoplasma testudineum TaxID=244584 RepID=A0A4R6IEK5_9MOLU|nr:HIT family protein [Mycoplasma testudineum]OYD26879.1 hypothetical protein CG473_02080 [Mycoplasma testudineum]TDO20414.1 histidine triad (HIT) family protein [Mycoplasma testudineum]